MKLASALAIALLALAGCRAGPVRPEGLTEIVGRDGLAVALELPKRLFQQGETFQAVVHARNTSSEPITITAPSAAPAFLGVWRFAEYNWTEIKRYPEAAAQVMAGWTLEPRSSRQFNFTITIGRDWPTNERLRITGEINGRPELVSEVIIEVAPI